VTAESVGRVETYVEEIEKEEIKVELPVRV